MSPSQLCQYVWESKPIKCKFKKLKYRYKIKLKDGTYHREKENHTLESNNSMDFETFSSGNSQVDKINSDIGMILYKISALDGYQNTLTSACMIFNLNFQWVNDQDLLKVSKVMEECSKSRFLDLGQAIALVMLLSYTKDRQLFQPFFGSLKGIESKSDLDLLIKFMNVLTTTTQVQQVATLILKCAPLRENVDIISKGFDKQIESCIERCSSFSQLEQCMKVMNQVCQSNDIKLMQKSVTALHKKITEIVRKSETSNKEIDVGLLQRVIDETHHCKPFFSDLLNSIVTSSVKEIWEVSTFVLKHETLHQCMEERKEFIKKWLKAAICFEAGKSKILSGYKCLQFLLDTTLVKEHKLVSYCEDLVGECSSKYEIRDVFSGSREIKNCVSLFLNHAKQIITEKARRSMQEGNSLLALVEPLLLTIRKSGVSCIIVNQRYVS